MSNPYSQIFSGINTSFGQDVGTGPYNVAAPNYDRGSIAGLDPSQMQITNKPGKRKGASIQHAYPLRSWSDGREERIMDNMPVFTVRYHEKKMPLTTAASVGQLNTILREANEMFKEYSNEADVQQFKKYLVDFKKGELEYYAWLRDKGMHKEMAKFASEKDGIADFYEKSTQDMFRYQTIYGILDRWNWLGVVLNKSEATSLMALDMTSTSDSVKVINVIQGEKARVYNYWGTLKTTSPGSTLWWVLSRVKTSSGGNGEFQITTYSSRTRGTVPAAIRKDAHVWKIGTVHENGKKAPSEGSRQAALGITTGDVGSYEATPRLPLIHVQLGI